MHNPREIQAALLTGTPSRTVAEQAFYRAAGAPLVAGNSVRVLKDAGENYPAWLSAIRGAHHQIFFESYIVAEDEIGREFVAALAERARAGVRVKAIYDWMGALGAATARLWEPLRQAGGEVRCFNPPQLDSPFGWITRDHRKLITVDGRVGFVGGLCVSRKWVGDPAANIEAWRDTAVEIRGPAVADLEQAFGQTWSETGPGLSPDDYTDAASIPREGEVALRVLSTVPSMARLYRLDQLIAVVATRSLWMADAYFVGVAPYVQALRAAAMDGVDVRLLVPGASDLPALARFSRTGYRVLLEGGVRVFEWNGPMMHAKTAVADGRWARVGSSNLNAASWLGNYEIDVAVEDAGVAKTMEEMYERDLAHATEIVLVARNRVQATSARSKPHARRSGRGSASRAAAGVLRIGNTVGAAMANRRVLVPAEAGVMAWMGGAFLAFALIGFLWPVALAAPLALFAGWIGASLLLRARRLRKAGRQEAGNRSKATPSSPA
jgi:cardiolipin synthase